MNARFKALVLCYHSANISGNEYRNNDHVALEHDLQLLLNRDCLVVSLADLSEALVSRKIPTTWLGRKIVGLSCDDGTNYDFYDYEHERWGFQKSFFRILSEAQRQSSTGAAACVLEMTAFVIASPEARTIMDRTSMSGLNRWTDEWWARAVDSGRFLVANHSWDHCSVSLPCIAQRNQQKGTFMGVDVLLDADRQVAQANRYISSVAPNRGTCLFAYPYGDVPPYLSEHYLPALGERIGLRAAFSTNNAYVTADTDRWAIPRFVCGDGWQDESQFSKLIDELS